MLGRAISYKPRSTVIKQRRKLKGTKITIQEDLTKQNQELLKKASRKPGVINLDDIPEESEPTHESGLLANDGSLNGPSNEMKLSASNHPMKTRQKASISNDL